MVGWLVGRCSVTIYFISVVLFSCIITDSVTEEKKLKNIRNLILKVYIIEE